MYFKTIGSNKYMIMPSTRKNKKYDVYVSKGMYGQSPSILRSDKLYDYLLSFGDIRYEHYKDKFGHYTYLNHNDKTRRDAYRKRHANDNIDDVNFAGFWSWHFLW